MIFKTVNSELEKTAYKIAIKNIDLASGHWGSEKEIIQYLDEVENFLFDKENFNKNIILHALHLKKENIRIKDLAFYRVKDENKMIILATTLVPRFKPAETFSREMSISFKNNDNFVFSIVELLVEEEKELKEAGKMLPENWILDEYFTDRYNKLARYL